MLQYCVSVELPGQGNPPFVAGERLLQSLERVQLPFPQVLVHVEKELQAPHAPSLISH